MILLARALVRVVSFLLLAILAVAGIVLAVFCIGTGTSGPSLGGLARLLDLSSLRDTVGSWLGQLQASGAVAAIAAVCGVGAMLLGLLLAGILVPRRERLVTLTSGEQGTIAARRRPLAQAATALVEQVRGVTEARVRVRPRRRSGGRLAVRASRIRRADPGEVQGAVREQLRGLTDPFKLKARVDVTRRGARVQ
ncbi:MAG: hypothetical protein ACXVII_39850 [Solirubrobacteraceae bacterium]